jgi:diguanylate cyclase (GGDEF)-like protein
MMAQGQPLGLFHITWQEKDDLESGSVQFREVAGSVAETLALAIANVRLREKLRDQSIRDPLTQLCSRRYLEDVVYREIGRARRTGAPIGVIMIDVYNLRQFNDSFGHPAGDRLLNKLGAYLKSRVRSEDVPARYGGEEFALILPGASCEIVRPRAEALREGFFSSVASNMEGLERLDGGLSISCGVPLFPDHGTRVRTFPGCRSGALRGEKRRQGSRRCFGGQDRGAARSVMVA